MRTVLPESGIGTTVPVVPLLVHRRQRGKLAMLVCASPDTSV